MRVGCIGLGAMGGPIAKHLVDADYPVTAFDIDEDRVAALVDTGATAGETAADVARESDIVFLSLPNPSIIEAVVLGEDGIAAELEEGDVLIDLSSSLPDLTESIASTLDEEGAHVLSAALSGGASAAREGNVSMMVGGDRATFDACQPVLESFAGEITYVGEQPGHGHAVKLLNNYLWATSIVATSEAMLLGKKAGIDPEAMLDVFNTSSGRNYVTENDYRPHILSGTYDRDFKLELLDKDLRLFTSFGEDNEVPLLLGETVRQLVNYARSDREEGADCMEIFLFLEKMFNREQISAQA